MSKPSMKRPFHYSKPNESLFYKETRVRVKKTPNVAEKQPRVKKNRGEKEKVEIRGNFYLRCLENQLEKLERLFDKQT